jgi:AraC-like DNA-binding protein
MDALTELLTSLRARAGVFLDAQFDGPWWTHSRVDTAVCAAWTGRGAHVAAFHLVVQGEPLLQLDGEPDRALEAGDIVVLPFNDLHALGNDPRRLPVAISDLLETAGPGGFGTVRRGGAGAHSHIVCGFVGFDVAPVELLRGMPRVIVLRPAEPGRWLATAIADAAAQCARQEPGADAVAARLTEIGFVLALRSLLREAPPRDGAAGPPLLRALADPLVGRALSWLHRPEAGDWTLERLAREVGASRTVLVERFAALVGDSPIAYRQRWRLRQAAAALASTEDAVAAIAARAGYASEAAFSRAFRRLMGVAPTAWRAGRRS